MSKINWWNLKLGSDEFSNLEVAFRQKKISYNSIGRLLEEKIAAHLGVKHVLLTTSGSTALLTALRACGISHGDEVIVPNRTFQATANAVLMAGAQVKLIDVDPLRATLNVTDLERVVTRKTKAIIPVHLNGRACDLEKILSFCKPRGIRVIEDAAQAFHSKSQNVFLGTRGDMGCFSMGTTKFLTTGQGGFIVTQNSDLYAEARKFIFQAYEGEDDKKFDSLGFNFRLSDLLSSLAVAQMENLQAKERLFLNIYDTYADGMKNLKTIKLLECRIDAAEIPIWIEVLCPRRDALFEHLKASGIESYKFYPSLHRSASLSQREQSFPNSLLFETQGLILPCGPHIPLTDCERVLKELANFESLMSI